MTLTGISLIVLFFWGCADDDGNGPLEPELLPNSHGSDAGVLIRAAVSDTVLAGAILRSMEDQQVSLEGMRDLSAADAGIERLDGIQLLSYLRSLSIAGNGIEDLEPLATLRSLRALDLSHNTVRDLLPLAALDSLEILVLDGNPVTDISALLALPSLQQVSLMGCPLAHMDTVISALQSSGVELLMAPGQDSTASDTGSSVAIVSPDSMAVRAMAQSGSTIFVAGSVSGDAMRPFLAAIRSGGADWLVLADSALVAAGAGQLDVVHSLHGDSLLIVHSFSGWLRTQDGGQTWQEPWGLPLGRVWWFPIVFRKVVAVPGPTPLHLMVTLHGPKLLASHDGGTSWKLAKRRVNDVAVSADGSTICVSTRGALWRSTDRAASFESLLEVDGTTVLAVALRPDDPAVAYFATTGGVYSVDLYTGTSDLLLAAPSSWGSARLYTTIRNPEEVYLIVGGSLPDGFELVSGAAYDVMTRQLLTSIDGGRTWNLRDVRNPRDLLLAGGDTWLITDTAVERLP